MPSDKTTTRVAIYARYSSDLQNPASTEDQIEVGRRYAERQGWVVVEVYADHTLSGASRFRSAFQQMLVDAASRRFDVVLAEALDRLSRKIADLADLDDRLTFLRVGLHTVATGEAARRDRTAEHQKSQGPAHHPHHRAQGVADPCAR